MFTPGGKIVFGIITTATTLFLSVYFLDKSINEKEPKNSFKYLILFVGCTLSFIFSINVR
ncbi:hypothetical protein JJB75_15580 [Clostridium perfringens]|uniref:hypothetical protein n=1 Tax=Clostridium perfringens TaxID=1502 RepID=UPI000EAC3895|nr:hypothetical protein [Clostridium perfringens]EHK2354924.1 hypothetical protein [Clostridium perfringens]ELC8350737.1 hypothetical protein [Clostridium perfringens]MBO3304488.1 hypothetical protein [Clostridium perfringens]MBO3307807.1 hypothetical protein [Clostridium perfringens]MBO3311137.1 hypothetical protein [Clostridium perfringens]